MVFNKYTCFDSKLTPPCVISVLNNRIEPAHQCDLLGWPKSLTSNGRESGAERRPEWHKNRSCSSGRSSTYLSKISVAAWIKTDSRGATISEILWSVTDIVTEEGEDSEFEREIYNRSYKNISPN